MLAAVGAESMAELLADVPAEVRLNRPLALPPALSEQELQAALTALAEENRPAAGAACFAGAGAYDHFIPAVVDAICSRGEFLTAYTPYQAEASQGFLQAFFEFQTLICQLTGMDVANASMYEAASALAEAIGMLAAAGRRRVVMCQPIHPHYLATVRTYLADLPLELELVGHSGGSADVKAATGAVDSDTAAVVVQSPNFYGIAERAVGELAQVAHEAGAGLVHVFDPISLAVFKSPGALGADVAVGEGQPLGIPLSFGGPYLGLLAAKEQFVRRMPGRLIGQTTDADGRLAYCLTLQTREQHIRRDKATSNICTNEGLCALRASVYLAAMGPQGLRHAATASMQRAHELARRMAALDGVELPFADRPFFREFLLRCTRVSPQAVIDAGLERGILPGVAMGPLDEEMAGCLLVACTEKRTPAEIDAFVDLLREVAS